jgi:hypothetical protein
MLARASSATEGITSSQRRGQLPEAITYVLSIARASRLSVRARVTSSRFIDQRLLRAVKVQGAIAGLTYSGAKAILVGALTIPQPNYNPSRSQGHRP